MKKKIVSVLLACAMTISLIGCGAKEAPAADSGEAAQNGGAAEDVASGETGASGETDLAENASGEAGGGGRAADEDGFQPLEEKITIRIGKAENAAHSYEPGDSTNDNYVLRWFEEQLNVDYEYEWAAVGDDAYNQKSALVISTGELPDVMTVTEPQLRQLVKADLVEDLTAAYDAYASDQLREAYATTNGIALESATFDGKLMAMPNINPGADGIPLLYVRADWMEELGLEEPKTLEDICAIVKAFQEKKGSGLVVGKSIVGVGNNMYGLDALFSLYHSYPEMWITDDQGKVAYGSILPETRTALENIAKLVQDGIIEKDFAVKDSDQCNEIVTSGNGGIFFGSWWNLGWPLADMWKSDESIDWNIYAVPLDGEGIYNVHMMNPSTTYLVVRKGFEGLEAVIKTLNLQRFVDSGEILIPKPVENAYESWTMFPFTVLMTTYDDKEKIAQNVNAVSSGEKKLEEMPGSTQNTIWPSIEYVEEHGVQKAANDAQISGYAWYRGAQAIVEAEDHMNRVFASTYAQSPSMEKKWVALEKLEDETFLQIILGEKPIEEFDNFVEQWKKLGGEEITAELQEMTDSQ